MLALLLVIGLPCRLAAQLDRGEVTGTIEDPSGAVVPNASITLTNDATNVKVMTKSTSSGSFTFDALVPGRYTILVEAPGFQHYVVHGVIVQVQQVETENVKLATGNVKQSVTVTAAAPLLNAENAQVGQTINTQEVNDLPLATRNWGSLAQMSAGVATAPTSSSGSGVTPDAGSSDSAYFSVDGVNDWQNDFLLNGINDNIEVYGGNYTGTNAAIVPPPDAMEEFTLQSGDYNAEFGHSTGGIINASIKSGTNHLHGDLWEYVRNNDLNANYFFNRNCSASGCVSKPVPSYHQNLFGFTAGGPVFIPHLYHGKNRTFWFADYQGGRYVLPEPAGGESVPTMGMRNSGFTNLQDNIVGNESATCFPGNTTKCPVDALGRVFLNGTIFDPATTRVIPGSGIDPVTGLTGTPGAYVRDPFYTNCAGGAGVPCLTGNTSKNFTGANQIALLNTIPGTRLDPNAVKLLGVYPLPEVTTVTPATASSSASGLQNNFASYVPIEDKNTNTWDIRIDEAINSNNTLFGVYDRSLLNVNVPGNLPGIAVGETGARIDSLPAYAWAVGYTRIFTPTLTNVMHVGMVHSDKLQQSIYGNTFGIPSTYGIAGIPQVATNGGLPPTNIAGLTHLGVGNYTPTLQYVWSIEGVDGVTKVFRAHTFKVGLDVLDLEANISQPPAGRGDLSFNGMYTDIPNRISPSSNGLNGIGDLLVAPTPTTLPGGYGGVDYVGGMNEYYGSDIAATDDHRWYWGAYFQDDWKATPTLTLNLGLRWDIFTPYAETRGRQANFVATAGNSAPADYYIPTAGCSVAESTSFTAALAANGITQKCVPSLTLGNTPMDNFSPRVGFAYSILPKLVVRGGFAMAYGALGNLGYGGTLGTNYPFVYTQTFIAPDSEHPLIVGAGVPATMETAFANTNFSNPAVVTGPASNPANVGLNLYGRQYYYQTPMVQTENLTIQDQFTNHDAVTVGYVGTQGRHLDNLGYSNSPSVILPPSANSQNYVPFPNFARNATYETTNAASSYNSLQLTYQHQMSAGLYLLANYTWSKCMTDQRTQADQYNTYNVGPYRAEWLPGYGIHGEYALCDTDTTNLVHAAGTYQLPYGNGRMFGSHGNRIADEVLGGWDVNFFYTLEGGQPFTVPCYQSTTADFGCTANVVPGENIYAGPHNYTQWLNPSAFAQPPTATAIAQSDYSPLGGYDQQARGPRFDNVDASLVKEFPVKEDVHFEFRAEAFNLSNTPPFAQPGQYNFSSANFSQITATKNSNQNFGARTLQLALKLFY